MRSSNSLSILIFLQSSVNQIFLSPHEGVIFPNQEGRQANVAKKLLSETKVHHVNKSQKTNPRQCNFYT
jgi:hypothetical protein